MNAFISFDLFIIYQNSSNSQELWNNTRRYEILHTLKRCCTVYLLLSESSAKINDLDVILHGFMLQIINITLRVRLFNRVYNTENHGINTGLSLRLWVLKLGINLSIIWITAYSIYSILRSFFYIWTFLSKLSSSNQETQQRDFSRHCNIRTTW